jgi:hypothetical protein
MKNYLYRHFELLEQQKIALGASIIFIISFILLSDYNSYSIIGLGASIFIALRLTIIMDETIPVLEIMLLIAGSQWLIGPFIDYQTEVDHYKMHMYVSEQRYMEITLPLFLVFTIATLQFSKFVVIDRQAIRNLLAKYKALPYYIIGLGTFVRLIESFLPPSLAFIGFLTINSSLIGLGLLYFSRSSWLNKLSITILAFLPLIYQSISSGMFHTIIIWGFFVFSFINLAKKIKLLNKIIILSFSISLLFTLQVIKKDYRATIYSDSFNGNKLELFLNLFLGNNISANKKKKEIDTETEQSNVNARLNQGWIISKIYERIPEKQDFIGGETIINAIYVSIVPRILAPNKAGGGGRATFEKLTGFTLLKNTAMGASLMGEFYGNYGFYGGMLCFLIWGRILNFVVFMFQKIQKNAPIIVFFLPVVFFQVIKAESDLTTVLNHLVKSIMFVALFMFFIRKVMNIRI